MISPVSIPSKTFKPSFLKFFRYPNNHHTSRNKKETKIEAVTRVAKRVKRISPEVASGDHRIRSDLGDSNSEVRARVKIEVAAQTNKQSDNKL
jgi:hypothetical protein